MNKDIPRRIVTLLLCLSAAATLIFGISMLMTTAGHPVAPLDDAYIHFQYARRLAQGHFFSYTEGAGFSTGATSFLYPVILAPFQLAGFTGARILLVTWGMGAACLFLSSLALYILGRDIASPRIGLLAALLFLLNGSLVWNYLSGMETGLFATFLLGGFQGIASWWEERRGTLLKRGMVFLCLASLTRPEGFIILLLACIFVSGRSASLHGWKGRFVWAALAPFALYMLMVDLKTGTLETAGVAAKSVISGPYYSIWEKAGRMTENFTWIFSGYYRNLSHNFFADGPFFPIFPTGALFPFPLFPLMALFLALAGVILGVTREGNTKGRGPLLLVSAALGLGLLSVTSAEVAATHYFRYLAPFQPLFLLLGAVGLYELCKIWDASGHRIFRFAGTLLVLLAIPSLFYWAWIYGENANDLYEQHRRMSWWIKDETPEDAVIGVTDAGIVGYFSQRRVYDFVGLCTPDQAGWWRQGLGSAYEKIERLAPEERPDHIVTFPFIFGDNSFLGTPVYDTSLRKNLTTMGREFVIFRQDWSYLGAGDYPLDPPSDLILADKLDVADLESEAAHGYRNTTGPERPHGGRFPPEQNFFHKAEARGRIIADGGRENSRREIFAVNLSDSSPVRMIARSDGKHHAAARIYINDKKAGVLEFGYRTGAVWEESALELPIEMVRKGRNIIQVDFAGDLSAGESLRIYHYWFYEKR